MLNGTSAGASRLNHVLLDVLQLAVLHRILDEAPRAGSWRRILPNMVGDQDFSLLLQPNDLASVVLYSGQLPIQVVCSLWEAAPP